MLTENPNLVYKKPETVVDNEDFRLLAIQHKLYIEGWSLLTYYKRLDIEKDFVALCFYDEIPIASCVVMNYGLVMFFVKEDFRRMGIGKKLISLYSIDKNNFALSGVYGSETFFKKVGVRLDDYYEIPNRNQYF